jgi:hypothetical protein
MSKARIPAGVDADMLAAVQAQLHEHDRTWEPAIGAGALVDDSVKELCSRFLAEEDDVVAHADDPERYDERERAALAWAQAIGWNPEAADEELWQRLRANFSEPQLVELGTFISIVLGQRRWLRTLGPLEDVALERRRR